MRCDAMRCDAMRCDEPSRWLLESECGKMSRSYAALTELPITNEELEAFRFSRWYHAFKKHTPQAKIISPLPQSFVQYLLQDGITLPHTDTTDLLHADESNDYSDWCSEEEDTAVVDPVKDFPDLHKEIQDIIKELGPVTPKLNWSAPKDAKWILPNNTLKCTDASDLYLLLNASDHIMHDLQNASSSFELVLRQWFNINPALEFRVFVSRKTILGVSQRDLNYYDYLQSLTDTFKDAIDEFIEEVVIPNFELDNFVVDLYIPRPFNKVYLIDINPFCHWTDPLMFSWNELLTQPDSKNNDYELRLITETNVARFASKEHSESQVPKDLVDASLNPEIIRELTHEWQRILELQQKEDTTKSDLLSDNTCI